MKKEEGHSDFTDRLVRLLAGELSAEERLALEQEVDASPEKKELYLQYLKIWENLGEVPVTDVNIDEEWQLFNTKWQKSIATETQGRVLTFRQTFYRVAAVLVIGIFLFAGYRSMRFLSETKRYLAVDNSELVVLPDGSRVTLNRGTVIRAFRDAGNDVRKVVLNGEAYFEVSRDTLHPFVIEAGNTMIEVLGTSFNVNAYREKKTVEVTVNTGIVAFSSSRENSNQLILRAGNSGVFSPDQERLTLVKQADPNSIAWITRKLVFDNAALGEVVERINQVYGTEIVIENLALRDCPITVTFENQSLSSVIAVLESTLNVSFVRSGKVLVIKGEGCE